MEKKTMGAFIAALRKASGMTQKELAERLNVSDKSVSRWERDETAPDLTLIPVIADVFGVTADELLRGERRPAEKRDAETAAEAHAFSARSEKELERLLKRSLTNFTVKSIISVGLAVLGLILSAILFFSLRYNDEEIPSLAGSVLLAAGLVCEIVFTIKAVAAANDAEIKEYPGVALYMRKVTWTAAIAFMAIFLVLASCIGGSIDYWWFDEWGIRCLSVAILLCGAACIVIKGILDKRSGKRSLWIAKLAAFLLLTAFFIWFLVIIGCDCTDPLVIAPVIGMALAAALCVILFVKERKINKA